MNVTHMLYEYSAVVDYIRALLEHNRVDSAICELDKLGKEIMNDYITSLAE